MGFDLTKFDQASDADQFIEIALAGLGAISGLLGGNIAGAAAGVIAAVRSVMESIQNAYDGKVPFDQVRDEFTKLLASLEANDAAADDALEHKFADNNADSNDAEG